MSCASPRNGVRPVGMSTVVSHLNSTSFSTPLCVQGDCMGLFGSVKYSRHGTQSCTVVVTVLRDHDSVFFSGGLVSVASSSSRGSNRATSVGGRLTRTRVSGLTTRGTRTETRRRTREYHRRGDGLRERVRQLRTRLTLDGRRVDGESDLLRLCRRTRYRRNRSAVSRDVFPCGAPLGMIVCNNFPIFRHRLLGCVPDVEVVRATSRVAATPVGATSVLFLRVGEADRDGC